MFSTREEGYDFISNKTSICHLTLQGQNVKSVLEMPPRERDPEQNQRRPRPFRHPEGSDGEDLVDDDEDIDDDDDDDDDHTDDEEIEVPPDPAHEARLAALRAENAELMAELAEQDRAIAETAENTRRMMEAIERRREELIRLRAARELREREALEAANANEGIHDQGDDNDSSPSNEEQSEQEVQETVGANKSRPDQKDENDSDPDNDPSACTF